MRASTYFVRRLVGFADVAAPSPSNTSVVRYSEPRGLPAGELQPLGGQVSAQGPQRQRPSKPAEEAGLKEHNVGAQQLEKPHHVHPFVQDAYDQNFILFVAIENPLVGRFLSRVPFGLQADESLNLYRYV